MHIYMDHLEEYLNESACICCCTGSFYNVHVSERKFSACNMQHGYVNKMCQERKGVIHARYKKVHVYLSHVTVPCTHLLYYIGLVFFW